MSSGLGALGAVGGGERPRVSRVNRGRTRRLRGEGAEKGVGVKVEEQVLEQKM